MADIVKACVNCGHMQATGDFCEACGTRLPPAAVRTPPGAADTVPVAAAPASPAPPPYASPPPYNAPAPYGAPQPGAPQYGPGQMGGYQPPPVPYGAPQYPVAPKVPREDVWGGLADFTFRRFPTPGLVRLAWIVTLVWVTLSLIVSIWAISDGWTGGRSVFSLLAALAVAAFTVVIVRVGLEAILALHRIREKKDQG